MKPKKLFKQQLLVEGNDDQHVIWALCQKFRIPQTFDVIDCKGIDKLYRQIEGRILSSDTETLGIIIDADMDLTTRWRQLKAKFDLDISGLPEDFPPNGLIHQEENNTKIGVWIMPDNNLNGMLEDFIRFLVPENDGLFPEVQKHIQHIENQGLHQYKPIHQSKALIHAWLALQEDPGTPMGLAITKRYLTTDAAKCADLIQWLNDLFNS